MAGPALPIQNMDLTYAMSDVYYSHKGGLFRQNYLHLVKELQNLQKTHHLEPFYLDHVVDPFINYLLYGLGEDGFNTVFSPDAEDLSLKEKRTAESIAILAEAALQRNYRNRYYQSSFQDLIAFQSIVDTIYNLAVKHMTSPMPPLVAWSRKHKGPFTVTQAKIEREISVPIGVVCLPPEYRNGGLLAWSVMGHEVAGHNFIQAKPHFLKELTNAVKKGLPVKLTAHLKREAIDFEPEHVAYLSEYWGQSQRVEEVASDILGILSTGPSLAIGCIGYFRGMSQDGLLKRSGPFEAKKQRSIVHLKGGGVDVEIRDLSEKVKIQGHKGVIGTTSHEENINYAIHKIPSGPHPIASLRPFVMIEAINNTKLEDSFKEGWAQLIEGELYAKEFSGKNRVVTIIPIDPKAPPTHISLDVARASAEIIGRIICQETLPCLGDEKTIRQIFSWSIKDEAMVEACRQSFHGQKLPGGTSARHIVAAAVMEASTAGANIDNLFTLMKQHLIKVRSQA